jgi:DNA-binding CsgD family transcriptional regulator
MADLIFKSLANTIGTIGRTDFHMALATYLRHCISYDNIIFVNFEGCLVPTVVHRQAFGSDAFKYVDDEYLPAAYLLDPIYHLHLNRGKAGIYRLIDVAPDQFRRSHYYELYYGRTGISDEFSIVLPVGSNSTITISMGMDESSGRPFSKKAESTLRQHEPAIMALIMAHWVISKPPSLNKSDTLSVTDKLIAAMGARHGIKLSKRQAETALLILRGHSSISIGLHLNISPQTVKVIRKQLFRKCQISSQAELFALLIPTLEWSASHSIAFGRSSASII